MGTTTAITKAPTKAPTLAQPRGAIAMSDVEEQPVCATCLAAIHLHSGGRVWMHDEPTAGTPYHAASPLPMPPLALS